MVTFVIVSLFLIALISIAIYLRQSASPRDESGQFLSPPSSIGLFGEVVADGGPRSLNPIESAEAVAERRRSLLERAGQGDKEALREASAPPDREIYDALLDALISHAGNNEAQLLSLISYIARDKNLRVTSNLAARFVEAWRSNPERRATAEMLHIAAMADDPDIYQDAIDVALQHWRNGKLQDVSASDLSRLAESEFWVISSEARSSGAGFMLKRKLASMRRELAGEGQVTSKR